VPHSNEGACLCGAIRFEIAGPTRWFAHCHCAMCRKQSGALFGTSLGIAERRFRWLAGEDAVLLYRASAAFDRPFCGRCGAKTPARSHEADSWTVPAGLVHGELGSGPRTHIFVAAKSTLAPITDTLTQHTGYPPGIALPAAALPPRDRAAAPVAGSCLCGAVAFEAGDPPREMVHCHCGRCRASTGAAFASTLAVPAADFRWTRGAERVRAHATAGAPPYRAAFCATCGSAAPLPSDDGATMLLPAGSLDTDLGPLPAVHVHTSAKAPWVEITDAWPRFPAERGIRADRDE
jgi:hypothetical protein